MTTRLRWMALLGVAAAAVVAARPALADPPRRVRLDYQRAPGTEHCPDERALRARLAMRLRRDPVDLDAAVHVSTTLTRGPGREVQAWTEMKDARGVVVWTRAHQEEDCDYLVRIVVATMAFAILFMFPEPAAPEVTPEPTEAPPTPPAPAPDPDPAPAPDPDLARSVPAPASSDDATPSESMPGWPHLQLGVGGGVSLGTLPGPSGGPALALTLRGRLLSLGLEGRLDLPAGLDLDDGGRLDAWLAAATVSPCAHFRPVLVCGFVTLGSLTSAGPGDGDAGGSSLHAAAGPRAGVELPLTPRLTARLHGDLAIGLTRRDFPSEDERSWTSPALTGLLGMRVDLALGAPP